ncbi:MAG: IPT/TIG domain-containing protein, partial [Rhodoferax sp.]|nr:IPT/TIG domain-containing protein [Rhodoferax sp.]
MTLLSPSSGSVFGGTVVSVYGSNFIDGPNLTCSFGATLAAQTYWVSRSEISCLVPNLASRGLATTALSVTNNGVTLSSPLPYALYQDFGLTAVSPAGGPTLARTWTVVTGYGLNQTGAAFCRFGLVDIVAASSSSATAVECLAPSTSTPGPVTVQVSLNGIDFSTTSTTFTYVDLPTVGALTPTAGASTGGTVVTLTGTGFQAVSSLACRFGVEGPVVAAVFLTPQQVQCVAPLVTVDWSGTCGNVWPVGVEVTVNGEDYSVSGMQFQYVPVANVSSVSPGRGPAAGGTVVSVYGNGFVDVSGLVCQFGLGSTAVVTAARWVSPSLVQCVSPAGVAGTSTPVSVSNNGVDFVGGAAVVFAFDGAVSVASVWPTLGSTTGGSQVVVTGAGFAFSSGLLCKFGSVAVAAQYLGPSEVSCGTPAMPGGVVAVSVTLNGVDFSANSVVFTFVASLSVTGLSPGSGSVTGGDAVSVSVAGLSSPVNVSSVWCSFGLVVTPAVSVTGNVVTCVSPGVGDGPLLSQWVAVEVSENGEDYTTDGVQFEYTADPAVTLLSPSSGSVFGGTVVSVYGSNFINGPGLACSFGSTRSPQATFVSSTLLTCVTPFAASPSSLPLSVSLNGVDFFAAQSRFEFVLPPVIESVEPPVVPAEGGTFVFLYGSGFAPLPELACSFNGTVVSAAFIDAHTVQCVTPAFTAPYPLFVNLTLSINGVDFYGCPATPALSLAPSLSVSSLSVTSGSVAGGTVVTLGGTNMPVADPAGCTCRFGMPGTAVPAVVLSATAATCITPPHAPGTVLLSLEWRATTFRPLAAALFTFVPVPVVTSVSPASGLATGGTVLTVFGAGFAAVAGLACRVTGVAADTVTPGLLDATVVPAAFLTPSSVQCVTPPHSLGAVSVSVSLNGEDWSNGAVYAYCGLPVAGALSPLWGPSRGGTPVTVSATNLLATGVVVCAFGNTTVVATIIDVSTAVCVSPPVAGALATPVTVSVNGVEFTDPTDPVIFNFYPDPVVVGVTPSVGGRGGGTLLTVALQDTVSPASGPLDDVQCIFGGVLAVPATLTPAGVQCFTPLSADPFQLQDAGAAFEQDSASSAVSVQVSLNGVDVSASSGTFVYVAPPSVTGVAPAFGSGNGGTLVTLTGSGFYNVPELRCSFEVSGLPAAYAPAVYLSPSTASCIVPLLPALGSFSVSVSLNGQEFAVGGLPVFQAVGSVSVLSFLPSAGPADGGTVVTVSGTGFLSTAVVTCAFGEVIVAAMVQSANILTCLTPPAAALGPVSLAVTVNGADVVLASGSFAYYAQPAVTSLSPSVGTPAGGTQVVVSVTMPASPELPRLSSWCLVGTLVLPAAVSLATSGSVDGVTTGVVTCVMPADVGSLAPDGWVSVSVALQPEGVTGPPGVATFPCGTAKFRVAAVPRLDVLLPPVVSDLGTTEVLLQGVGFVATSGVVCAFVNGGAQWDGAPGPGVSLVAARYVAVWLVGCTPPARAPTTLSVYVSNNGQEWSGEPTQLVIVPVSVSAGVAPLAVLAGADAVITINASNLEVAPNNTCVFGAANGTALSSPALLSRANGLQCVVPPEAGTGAWSVSVDVRSGALAQVGTLTVLAAPVLQGITPAAGAEAGGAAVRVLAQGGLAAFAGSSAALCSFGSLSAPAAVVSDTALICSAPSGVPSTTVTVTVSLDGVYFLPFSFPFTYTPTLHVASVLPASGAIQGGTPVAVTGGGFFRTPSLTCKFGGAVVPATFYNSSLVFCTTPVAPTGLGRVEVAVCVGAAASCSADGTQFFYVPEQFVTELQPVSGPLTGGTVVTIAGVGFAPGPNATCTFGTVIVPAADIGAGALSCVSPPAAALGPVNVTLSFNGFDVLPVFVAGGVPSLPLAFLYQPAAVASSFAPILGPSSGGTPVTIAGAGFLPGHTMCQFGDVAVPATVNAGGSEAVCTTPATPPGFVSPRLSTNDGVDWFPTFLPQGFLFTPAIAIAAVFPSTTLSSPASPAAAVILTTSSPLITDVLTCQFSLLSSPNARLLSGGALAVPVLPVVQSAGKRLNATAVRCPTPLLFSGEYGVAVSQNGGVTFEGAGGLSVVDPPQLLTLSPSTASGRPYWPSVPVHVYGTEFFATPALACAFGPDDVVPATFLSPNHVLCPSPVHDLGTVLLSVTINGVDFTPDYAALPFVFAPLPTVASVWPVLGSVVGGTLVTVSGANFAPVPGTYLGAVGFDNVVCEFGEGVAPVPAMVQSPTSLTCIAPPAAWQTPAFVTVRVAVNGYDLSDTAAQFQYTPPVIVTAVQPVTGPETGGSLLTILGSGFSNLTELTCRFDAVVVPAVWLAETQVACVAPAHAPGAAAVSVSSNGEDYSTDPVYYAYATVASAASLWPAQGPLTGGTLVTLSGRNFVFSPLLACVFGTIATPASFINASALTCSSPPAGSAGPVPVALTLNGVDVASDALEFAYTLDAVVSAVQPAQGPSGGGTLVTLTGEGFVPGATLFQFSTPSAVEPETGVLQSTYPYATPFGGPIPAVVSADGTSASIVVPPHAPGMVSIMVSTNAGANWVTTSVGYTFRPSTSVQSVSPPVGPERGGWPLTLFANYAAWFPKTPDLSCVFTPTAVVEGGVVTSPVVVAAVWLNPSVIGCIVPALPVGTAVVEVTYNGGADVTTDGVTITLHGPVELLELSPQSGPVAGGSAVTIRGNRFELLDDLRCMFGRTPVPAVFVNTTAVVCRAPAALGQFSGPLAIPLSVPVRVLSSPEDTLLAGDGAPSLTFTYTQPAVVVALQPINAPVSGGVLVSVFGWFLAPPANTTDGVLCRFGDSDVFVVPVAVSTQRVDCVAPPRAVGPVSVDISTNNGVDFSASGVNLSYVLPTRVFSVYPVLGPETGGTTVTVYGAFFVQTYELSCRFAPVGPNTNSSRVALIVPGAFVSSTIVQCISPPLAFGLANVEVSNNGFDFSTDSVVYTYHNVVLLASLSPPHGPAQGGTAITIVGDLFLDTVTLYCRFDQLVVPALYVSPQALQCSAPMHPPGSVAVDISLNSVDFTQDYTLSYEYDMDQFVTAVAPAKGPVTGGTLVTVTVAFTEQVPTLLCRFGPTIVSATYVSPFLVSCVAPVSPILDGGLGGGGTVAVEVTVNGQDFSASKVQFTYELEAFVSGVNVASVPEDEGVELAILGSQFVSSPSLLCSFVHSSVEVSRQFVTSPAVVVTARFVSAHEVRCLLPGGPVGSWSVDVSNNGQQFTNSNVSVAVLQPVTVYGLWPPTGPAWGGTRVTLLVANLPGAPGEVRPLCRFNTTVVVGEYDSEAFVSCVSPPVLDVFLFQADLGVAVEVSINGGWHFSNSGLVYTYFPAPVLTSGWASPRLGGVEGGTIISVTTTGISAFLGVLRPRCRIGNVNDTNMYTVPASVSPTNASVLTCVTLAHPVGLVTITVTMNGEDYAPSGLRFEYVLSPRVTSLMPRVGLQSGGTLLTLTGINFLALDTLLCRFRTSFPPPVTQLLVPALPVVTTSPALWINSTVLQCVAPPTLPSTVSVEVSINAADFSADRVQYTFLPYPRLVRFTPHEAPVLGGTPVTVYSTGFTESVVATCRFGVYDVPAAYVSRNEVRCMAPPQPPGVVTFEVTFGSSGQESSRTGWTFEYITPALVHSLSPWSGPAVGGTTVTLVGENFRAVDATACYWGTGNASTPALVVNSTSLQCVSPPLPVDMLGESNAQGQVVVFVDVGTVGHTFTHSFIPFRYLTPCRVTAVNPTFGPAFGGTRVTVSGYNFLSSIRLACVFGHGSTPSPAQWLSSTSLQCVSPGRLPSPSNVTVEVTNNGQQYTSDGFVFEYQVDVELWSVAPLWGTPDGGTRVGIIGRYFVDTANLLCMFGTLPVRAMYVNSTYVVCDTPSHQPGSVLVWISQNGADYNQLPPASLPNVTFTFQAVPNVTSIYPDAGSIVGGTRVVVNGAGFGTQPDGQTLCKFVPARVQASQNVYDVVAAPAPFLPATFVSSTQLVCVAPAFLVPGPVYVQVTNNAQEYSASGVIYWAQLPVRVTAVSPATGPAEGGTVVSVKGVNFINRAPLVCRFHGAAVGQSDPLEGSASMDVLVTPRWLSSTLIECVTPPHYAFFSVFVSVDVSNNAVDFTDDAVLFQYYPRPIVNAVFPVHGTREGGTLVTLTGQNFGLGLTLCRFGLAEVPALYVSSNTLVCWSPAHEEGVVTVEVTGNNRDYTADGVVFLYRPHTVVDSVTPFFGTVFGDTVVTVVVGTPIDVADYGTLRCRFGTETVRGITSPGAVTVTCPVPPSVHSGSGSVIVDLTENGEDWTSSGVVYTYGSPAAVFSLQPNSGSGMGGQLVVIAGRNFSNHATAACSFGVPYANGSLVVPALWHSPQELRCVAPAHPPGAVVVEVTLNGQDYTYSGIYFTYVDTPVIDSVSPTHGPWFGQTAVTISGHGFSSGSVCRFGRVFVPALEVLSSDDIVCVSPPSFAHAGAVALEVSTDNSTFSNYGVLFTYDQRVTIESVSPWFGTAVGGTTVVVYGSNFLDTVAAVDSTRAPVRPQELFCRFDDVAVPAQYLSP